MQLGKCYVSQRHCVLHYHSWHLGELGKQAEASLYIIGIHC